MEKVIAAVVGYAPDLEHLFAVSTSHGNALQQLLGIRKEYGVSVKNIPKYYGFVIKAEDGSYYYANRSKAYEVAKAADQLKDVPATYSKSEGSLDSYNLKGYDKDEIQKLFDKAVEVCKSFSGKVVDNVLP